jgi:hypothetical protein
MQEDKPSPTWTIAPSVRATFSPDGAVLLDIEKGLCYSLNPVGMKIWRLIESGIGKTSFESIVAAIASEFALSREQLAEDIGAYLEELTRKGLLRANGAPSMQRARGGG